MSVILPSRVPCSRDLPSLHRVPVGQVPRLRRYYEGPLTPCRPFRHPSFPRVPVPPVARCFRSHRSAERASMGLVLVHPVDHIPGLLRWRRQGLAGSCGTPWCMRPALRPRWDLRARPLRHFGAAGGLFDVNGSHDLNITGLHHTAHALAVYASPVGSPRPTQDSLLAAGQTLPGGTGYPPGPSERFQV